MVKSFLRMSAILAFIAIAFAYVLPRAMIGGIADGCDALAFLGRVGHRLDRGCFASLLKSHEEGE